MTPPTATTEAAADPGPRSATTIVEETDGYTSALGGVTGEAVRIGRGIGPNVLFGAGGEQLLVTSARIGFPLTRCVHVPDDRVVVAFVHENPAETRWCVEPIPDGTVLVYPPGSEHVGVDSPGMRFTMAVADPERLMSMAERLGLPAEIPRHTGMHAMPESSVAERMGEMLDRQATPGLGSETFERYSEQTLAMFAELLSDDVAAHAVQPRRGLDSRVIVTACIDYAAAIDRIPSIAEMCTASNVSQRRLRLAFNHEFDQSPTRYFRTWALDRAHSQLRDAAPGCHNVSDIACDLGFGHLGRFAGWYKNVYGEAPSQTLHTVQ